MEGDGGYMLDRAGRWSVHKKSNNMEQCSIRVAAAFLTLFCLALAKEMYTTQYDNIDLDEILTNERLYKKYFDCVIGEGKCTPDGKELKETVPDALANECNKCSEKQKAGAEKVIKYVIENKPEDYKRMEAIYDPKGTYKMKYKEELAKRGIKIID